ncbi:MAG: hypothetical protein V2A73_00425 [Pseudomonadota bacterium]
MITISVPIKIESELNLRGHWANRAKRFKAQRHAVYWAWRAEGKPIATLPAVVRLVRLGKKTLDDDNLAGSFKAIRDEIAAEILHVDDADPRVRWEYAQQQTLQYSVRIEIREAIE